MCGHLHPLCVHTYGYDYVRVCLRFCVCVASCTVRVRMRLDNIRRPHLDAKTERDVT